MIQDKNIEKHAKNLLDWLCVEFKDEIKQEFKKEGAKVMKEYIQEYGELLLFFSDFIQRLIKITNKDKMVYCLSSFLYINHGRETRDFLRAEISDIYDTELYIQILENFYDRSFNNRSFN
jgi:hypothetical protein